MAYLLVFLGGGLGATLRHAVNTLCARLFGTHFPFGTFLINVTGSLVMGLIAGYLAFRGQAAQPWRLFVMTGVLGGYTTFSAFSLDAALLYERGEVGLAAAYVLGSVILALGGLAVGLTLMRQLT
jgi:CrcB protein